MSAANVATMGAKLPTPCRVTQINLLFGCPSVEFADEKGAQVIRPGSADSLDTETMSAPTWQGRTLVTTNLATRPSAIALLWGPRMSFAAAETNSGNPVMERYS